MDGFLDAIRGDQGTVVTVGGVPVFVERARLGLHFRLARIADEFDQAQTAGGKAEQLRGYLSLLGLFALDGIEAIEAFIALRHLNRWQWVVPWIDPERNKGADKGITPPYSYKDRWLAGWVHSLASRYGWSRDEIFNLWPEEAAAYIQEIEVAEYNEREDRRALSEVSYRYDKGAKISRFVRSPMPVWMVDNKPPAPIRIARKWLPVGNVVMVDDQG